MRWAGPFPTPNVAGMELAAALVICALLTVHLWPGNRQVSFRSASAIACGLAGVFAAYLLICTGSRAGVVAAISAALVMVALRMLSPGVGLGIALTLLVSVCFSPNADRFEHPMDVSMSVRIAVWQSGLALIVDHPWGGVGLNDLREVVNIWYHTGSSQTDFGTFLNDPITIAGVWGLPALAAFSLCLATALVIGILRTRQGNLLAAIGVILMVTHCIASQFQAHLFSGWRPAYLVWIIGAGLAVLGRVPTVPNRLLWLGPSLVLVGIASVYPIGLVAGRSSWTTIRIDHALVGIPSHTQVEGFAVAIAGEGESTAQIRHWLTTCRLRGEAAAVLRYRPDPGWLHEAAARLTSRPTQVTMLASGACATELWNAWRQHLTGDSVVMVCDPLAAPAFTSSIPMHPTLRVVIAAFCAWPSQDAIVRAARADGAPIDRPRALSAEWWLQ